MANDIMQLLRWRRKAGSKTLAQFVKHYMGQWDLEVDTYGNLFKRVGTAPILWSCHLDSVHRKEGWQNVRIDSSDMIRQLGNKSRCLGADDGAGIWLLLEMLDNGVEGLYVFHQDEEIGGKGSKWITTHNTSFADGIKYAVAFDRKSTHSVITNQWGPCCSDRFGKSLASEIGMGHVLDTTGRFTDTDNYKELVPECTNVSVGYYNEHTKDEYLDFGYLQRLRDAMMEVNIDNLIVDRKPTTYAYGGGRRGGSSYHHSSFDYDDNYWTTYQDSLDKAKARAKAEREEKNPPVVIKPGMGLQKVYKPKPGETTATNIENLERLCSLNARKMARVLLDMGASYQDVLDGFFNLDLTKKNVALEDSKNDGWLSVVAKYVLGIK